MRQKLHEITENSLIDGLDASDLNYLRAAYPKFMAPRRGGWALVRAVGHVVLPSGTILRVRSAKAPAYALASWLAYVDPSLRDLLLDREADDLADEGAISGILAAMYVKQLIRACSTSGVMRHYHPVQTLSAYVRGKIDFSRQIARGYDLSRVPCTSWERDPNTPLNCFLVAALERARQDPLVSTRLARSLASATLLLSGVPARIDERLLHGKTPLQRDEWPFHGAYKLARMILSNARLGDGQSLSGFAFMLDLERLFEGAVIKAFQSNGIDCTKKKKARYLESGPRNEYRLMYLDLLCTTPDGLLVVDAKFKHAINASNLQQMVTYCFMCGARKAWLVLPGEAKESSTFQFDGPDGQPIVIETRFLATSAPDVVAWEANGRALVQSLVPGAQHPVP